MKFRKFDHTPQNFFRHVPSFWGGVFSFNQQVYRLPETDSKVWYENRDGWHTNATQFENTIVNTDTQTSMGINVNTIYQNGIVVSNSSTARSPDESGGSNTRQPDSNWTGWYCLREMWQAGVLQFFPEYRDYDDVDWFKVNQPYVFTTQGSSGSELNEVERCRRILLALRPEVRQWLIDNKRVGDVVSYLMRSNQYSGYLDPLCHRVVIDGRNEMPSDIDLAESITLETIPPLLKIKVISDSLEGETPSQKFGACPLRTDEAVGLIRTTSAQVRTIVVELEADRPCQFHWVKCQGESSIVYNNPDKTRATITIPIQGNFDVLKPDSSVIVSNRVEVIAVAHDGTHYSSPVFVTEYFPPAIRTERKRMNEISIHADNSFKLKVNGDELRSGNDWKSPHTTLVRQWQQINTIEVEVINAGGPGGMLGAVYVGDVLHVTDASWQASLDRVNWVAPSVMSHAGSPWDRERLVLPAAWGNAAWLWHPQATENSTVYFRKTIGAVLPEPVPTPTPQPVVGDFERRITALESTISKLKDVFR